MSAKLDEIEARLKAATPGPWWTTSETAITVQNAHALVASTHSAAIEFRANAQLIAHAPADLALLLRIARAATALMDVTEGRKVCSRACVADSSWACERCQGEERAREALRLALEAGR
jgi:hypothetical protein